jgi:hypothetical protein
MAPMNTVFVVKNPTRYSENVVAFNSGPLILMIMRTGTRTGTYVSRFVFG